MTIIRTDLGDTRERARELRFEKVSGIPATDVQEAIEDAYAAAIAPQPIASTAVTPAMSPYVPLSTDTVLYVDSTAGAVVINMPLAAARAGIALVVKDVGGAGATNNITINPSGAETIDSLASLVINADFGGYRLNPRSAVGYTVSP